MNPIKKIEIKNFKSIRHQTIDDCKRINVFIGYPNVGKSNILEAIGLYSSFLLKDEYFKINEICRVKNFSDLFFNKDYRNACSIVINDAIQLEVMINSANDLELRAHDIHGQHVLFSMSANNINFTSTVLKQIMEVDYKNIVGLIRKYEFKTDSFINQKRPFTLAVPFGVNLLDILQRDSLLRKEVASLFGTFNLKLFLDGEEIKFLKYLDDGTGVSIAYYLVADTLRRLIFYKAALLSNKESVLLFEEPEAHMFPPYISKFTADVMYDKNDNQFFITTHSPFVINDFMENLKNDELSIYVVDYKKETGESLIRKLTDEELHEIYQHGIDLYFNLENYLMHEQQ
jgi:AAA15 family ATPase/GTPase